MTELEQLGLEEVARRYRDGSLDPVEVAAACAERQRHYGDAFGAYQTPNPQLPAMARLAGEAFARGLDLGPLQGIPVSVKDLFGVPGLPTYAGSPAPLPAAWEEAGPLVAAVRRQLAPVTGKTHTVEFAYGGLGTNPHWPVPRNPWAVGEPRVPGGSSAGAGVSLVEGSALLALGTDTAGSVRIPASMTGTVGLKPTIGRWPTAGIVPLSTSFDTPGLLARSVADVVWGFRAIEQGLTATTPQIPRLAAADLRIGVPETFFWDDCSPGVAEAVQGGLRELQAAGARLQGLELAGLAEAHDYFRAGGLTTPELYRFLRHELPDWLETLDPNVRKRMQAAVDSPAWEYLQRRERFAALGEAAARQLATVDVLAVPAVAITPPTLAELEPPGAYPRCNLLALRNTSVANLFGLCALTLPVGLDQAGMPVGLMLMAPPRREERLLAAAAAIEAALGTGRERLGRAPGLSLPAHHGGA